MLFNSKHANRHDATDIHPVPEVAESPNAAFFKELFCPEFIHQHTDFRTMEELILMSGFRITTVEDISRFEEKEWNDFLSRHTRFDSWESMQQMAFSEWSKRKLGI